ncbi:MAG TPA: dTMP kinase [Methanocellaceae archaeon]
MNGARGFLISVEGIDGTGKTTQVELLKAWFERMGKSVVCLKEPTSGRYGSEIARLAATGGLSDVKKELELFMLDRREDVKEHIEPALNEGRVVIMDRYYQSNMAYQGARGLDPLLIKKENEAFSPKPDLIIVLDIDPEKCMKRVNSRKNVVSHFENEAYLRDVRRIYLEIGKGPNAAIIETDRPVRDVHEQIVEAIKNKLPQAIPEK